VTRSALETPMMRQYLAIKSKHPDSILFYRMGDFYEMFLRDAELAAPLLEIALTTRDRGKPDAVPMCGVPAHAVDAYIQRLAELGHRVAVCEQVEDAGRTGGRRLVRREVVEVVTPGLVGDPAGIAPAQELVVAALLPGPVFGLAALDASTGDLRATEVPAPADAGLPSPLAQELLRLDPRELLCPAPLAPELLQALARLLPNAARTLVEAGSFEPAHAPAFPHGLEPGATGAAPRAAAGLLAFLASHQPFALAQISRLRSYRLSDSMLLDAATRAHLELFRNGEDGSRRATLIERIDHTATPLGARRLVSWLAYPLLDPAAIAERQRAVAWLAGRDRPRARLREALRRVRDLERSLAKLARPSATPRDLAGLRGSLEALPTVRDALASDPDAALGGDGAPRPVLLREPEALPELARMLREALVDDPPALVRGSRGALETGFLREGFHAELDALREAGRKGREWIAGLEVRERERTGIGSLKIRFHPVHGYGIEISKPQLRLAPADYERKQTLASAERFTTAELRDIEQNVIGAQERAAALERTLFESLRQATLEQAARVRTAAEAVADLDAFASLAEVARQDDWVRPEVDASDELSIRAGRHPVVEPVLAAQGGEAFVANDTWLSPSGRQLLVLTGPNMSGKSTYLRQVALIVLLAQIGSFVPAQAARVGAVDRVFTRVGASDRLARGESTFMVEMRETAEILAHASRHSLVILDEIGRGTSTFDGLSIAWAVAEYLHDTPGLCPRTLFATHYHELADLARTHTRAGNAHFEVREWGEDVIFLRRLLPGAANRSYGIQVARLAGLPAAVIDRAKQILRNLEGGELDERGRPRLAGEAGEPVGQLGLFGAGAPQDPSEREVLVALRALDPERTTPLEALAALARLRAQLGRDPA
jgi:DNA mismatch repair protein MutS